MLKIKNLSTESEAFPSLKEISLEVKAGEIHAIMGPEDSGKSALAHSIVGHPLIDIKEGDVLLGRKKLNSLEVNDRSGLGIFVSFQSPPEFETVTNWDLMKEVLTNSKTPESELKLKYQAYCKLLDLGSSHGDICPTGHTMLMTHAKRNEVLQMLMLNPKLIILDEVDVGLTDTDLELVCEVIKDFLAEGDKGCIVITHSQKLLSALNPTHVHVMVNGEIKLSGDSNLYTRIIEDGYSEFS